MALATTQIPLSDRKAAKNRGKVIASTVATGSVMTGILVAVVMLMGSGWMALAHFSSHSLAFGSSTLAGLLALLWLSVKGWDFPAAANWPWLGVTSVLATVLLPLASIHAVTEVSFGWALLAALTAALVYQLGRQLLLFRRSSTMAAWQFVVALPISALLFGHSLGLDAMAIETVRDASGLDAIAMAIFGATQAAVWYLVWKR